MRTNYKHCPVDCAFVSQIIQPKNNHVRSYLRFCFLNEFPSENFSWNWFGNTVDEIYPSQSFERRNLQQEKKSVETCWADSFGTKKLPPLLRRNSWKCGGALLPHSANAMADISTLERHSLTCMVESVGAAREAMVYPMADVSELSSLISNSWI